MKKPSKISDEDKKRFRDAVGNVKPIKNDNIISERPKPSTYQKKDKTERYQELGKTPHRKYWALFALTEV